MADLKPNEKQINIFLDKDLHAEFKAKTALNGKSIRGTLVEFIKEYVEKHEWE